MNNEELPSFMEKSFALHRELYEILQKYEARIACCVLVSYLKQYAKRQPNRQEIIDIIFASLKDDQEDHD